MDGVGITGRLWFFQTGGAKRGENKRSSRGGVSSSCRLFAETYFEGDMDSSLVRFEVCSTGISMWIGVR